MPDLSSEMRIFSPSGQRLYLNDQEKAHLVATAKRDLAPEWAAYFEGLCLTGCRVSEMLAVRAVDLNTDAFEVQLKTLKKRKDAWRIIPLPETYFDPLQAVFNLRKMQATKSGSATRLWGFSRQRVSQVAATLFASAGLDAFSPKACRHGFAISALGRGIPLTLVSEMMGHSSLEVTAIYAKAMNSEKRAMVARLWTN